ERRPDVPRPRPRRALARLHRPRPCDGRRPHPPPAGGDGGRHAGVASRRTGARPVGILDEPPARGCAALDLAGPGTIITGMASETATPDLLTALLEHIRVLF